MRAAVAALSALLLVLAGCGGGDGSTTGAAGAAGEPDLVNGREVFISFGCGSCHHLAAANTDGISGPDLDESIPLGVEASGSQLEDYVRTSIVNPGAWVMPQYSDGVMPTDYESQLTEEQLDDLVAFIVDAVSPAVSGGP